jgi:hypothetical protein
MELNYVHWRTSIILRLIVIHFKVTHAYVSYNNIAIRVIRDIALLIKERLRKAHL